MSATITPERLELCRLVREHCYSVDTGAYTTPAEDYVRELCLTALDVPIETMASWFMMDETVMANIRLAMTMAEQTMVG